MAANERIEIEIRGTDAFSGAFSRAGATVIALNQAVQLAQQAFRGLNTAFLAVVETSDKFRRVEIQLTSLTGSLGEAREALAGLQQLARETPQRLVTLQAAFVRLKATGVEDTERAIRALTNAVAAFGGTDDDLRLATLAIQQMAGKGVISMEELRRQLGERIPTAIKIMARELDLSTAELFKRVEAGALDATTGINALITGFEKDFSGAAERMVNTWAGATSNLADAWDQFLRALGDTGVLDAAIDTLKVLTLIMRDLVDLLKRDVVEELAEASERLAVLEERAERGGNAFGELNEEMSSLRITILELTPQVDGLAEDLESVGAGLGLSTQEAAKFKEGLAKLKKEAEDLAAVMDTLRVGFEMDFDVPEIPLTELLDEQAILADANRIFRQMAEDMEGVFEDSEIDLGDTFAGIGNQFAGQVAGLSGAIAGFQQGGPLGAIGGFGAELLLSNEKFQEALAPLNEALIELTTPIAEALAPAMQAFVPILQRLQPVFELIGAMLEVHLAPLVAALEELARAMDTVNEALRDLGIKEERLEAEMQRMGEDLRRLGAEMQRWIDAIRDFIEEIKNFAGVGGGGGGEVESAIGVNVPGVDFHQGGILTNNDLIPFAGAAPGEGLFIGQTGERVLPRGESVGTGDIHITIQGTPTQDTVNELVRRLEEQSAIGRLRL